MANFINYPTARPSCSRAQGMAEASTRELSLASRNNYSAPSPRDLAVSDDPQRVILRPRDDGDVDLITELGRVNIGRYRHVPPITTSSVLFTVIGVFLMSFLAGYMLWQWGRAHGRSEAVSAERRYP